MIKDCEKAYDEHGGFTEGELASGIIMQHINESAIGNKDQPFSQIFTVDERVK